MAMSVTDTLPVETRFSSNYELIGIKKESTLDVMYKLSNQMLLTGYTFDDESQQFLNENQDVGFAIPQITNLVNSVLRTEIIPVLEVVRDEESFNVRRLSIVFNVAGKSYQEILRIWDNVSKEVYSNISDIVARKISIVLDGD
jgi:hypothetical protein